MKKRNTGIQTINFKTFLAQHSPGPSDSNPGDLKLYSLYISPMALFDPTFMAIGAGVLLVAILEKQLSNHGLIYIAASISAILRIAFPVVAAGSLFYLLSHLSFLMP